MTAWIARIRGTPLRYGAAGTLAILAALPWLGWCEGDPVALRRAQAQARAELERGARLIQSQTPLPEGERARWAQQLDALARWLPPAPEEARVLAELARHFEGTGVRDLELLPQPTAPGEALLDWETLEVTDPMRRRVLHLRAVPLRIRLRAEYVDIADILETLESRSAPLLPSRLRIEREHESLRLETELIFVVRGGSGE